MAIADMVAFFIYFSCTHSFSQIRYNLWRRLQRALWLIRPRHSVHQSLHLRSSPNRSHLRAILLPNQLQLFLQILRHFGSPFFPPPFLFLFPLFFLVLIVPYIGSGLPFQCLQSFLHYPHLVFPQQPDTKPSLVLHVHHPQERRCS